MSTHYNDHGQLMGHQFRLSRDSQLRDGSYEYGQVNVNSAGYDDMLTRGNGALWLPPSFNSYFSFERPRQGRWGYQAELQVFSGGLSGNDRIGYGFHVEPRYFVSDAFQVPMSASRSTTRRTGCSGSTTTSSAASTGVRST